MMLRPNILQRLLAFAAFSGSITPFSLAAPKAKDMGDGIRARQFPSRTFFGRGDCAARHYHVHGAVANYVEVESIPTRYTETGYRLTRNSPCPCKSGRRFKACCQLRARDLHLEDEIAERRIARRRVNTRQQIVKWQAA